MEKLIFEKSVPGRKAYSLPELKFKTKPLSDLIPEKFLRKTPAPLPEVSEIEVARHYFKLSQLNYCVESGLYPLGSCTMKYNPKSSEKAASFSGFAAAHPLTPEKAVQGALKLMSELQDYLNEITGMDASSLQPMAGANGEFTGIALFAAYHRDRGDLKRTKILIPDSAHGTNPASSALNGFEIVKIDSNSRGLVDIDDLKAKVGDDTAGFMLTNPNTLGLFESQILEIGKIVREAGGLMYMDGANLNAIIGRVRPGDMGFDCVHLNLHKTFSTPHGGGGPGAGPICVKKELEPYLPVPRVVKKQDKFELSSDFPKSVGRIAGFYGNFGVFVKAYNYIRLLGSEGLKDVSKNALVNANYLLAKLKDRYEAPYGDRCMHEFALSGEKQKNKGAATKDIAKRLLDYGFHAPTIYFPLIVKEALLIEPTETESLNSIDAFAEAMIKIADEIDENPELVKSAPLTAPVKRLNDALAVRNLDVNWFAKSK